MTLELPVAQLKRPTVLSPGLAGSKRGRAPVSGTTTPAADRSPVRTRVNARRGARRPAFEV